MFGYILAVVIGLVLVGLLISGMTRSAPAGRETKPLQNDGPAADEPNPDRSATAPARTVEQARRKTPPA